MNALSSRLRFTKARSSSFYYSFIFLPREKRRAIKAVYAFARRGDDAVDSGRPWAEATEEMAHCRGDLDACYGERAGGAFDTGLRPELRALAEAVERFKIPRCHFDELMLGLEMDLNGTRYATFDDLLLYSYRVASTIGLIAIEIFGFRNPRSRDYAVNLGTALQLVNILRDLPCDARRGRVYLPEEDLQRFQVEPQELVADRPSDGLIKLTRFEADRARHYFTLARRALPREDRRSMLPAEMMAAIYWRLLRRIEQRAYSIPAAPVRLSRPVKLWTALSVYLGFEWFR
jgi:phytoene synthase